MEGKLTGWIVIEWVIVAVAERVPLFVLFVLFVVVDGIEADQTEPGWGALGPLGLGEGENDQHQLGGCSQEIEQQQVQFAGNYT